MCNDTRTSMRAAFACAFLLSTLVAASAAAQTYDHVHLAAPEPAKAVEWYRAHLGAQAGDLPDRVQFGKTIFAFIQSTNASLNSPGASRTGAVQAGVRAGSLRRQAGTRRRCRAAR